MTPTDAQGSAPRCSCGHATHEGTCKAIVGKREGALSVTRYCGCTRAAPSLGTTTPRERHAVWCDYWIPIPKGGIAYPCSCNGFPAGPPPAPAPEPT
jgi:hypothetical protein